MAHGARDWHGIRGSAALRTAPLRAEPAVVRAESLQAGEMRRVPVAGELLGAARVRGRFATLPLEAFDRAGALLEPEEQGAFFQLLRLSWGEGRNFCRVPKRELLARLGASERRVNRILDGLVEKGFVRLLHRDNRGTLLRVFLPREARGEPLGDDVLLGAPANDAGVARLAAPAASPAASTATPTASAAPAATPAPRRVVHLRPGDAERLGAALAEARGEADDDALAAATDEVRELLADGATPRQVEAAIHAVARRRAALEGETP